MQEEDLGFRAQGRRREEMVVRLHPVHQNDFGEMDFRPLLRTAESNILGVLQFRALVPL